MALIDSSTAQVIAHCTPEEARQITDDIKGAAETVWTLLVEAHDRQAWAALGYGSWRDYAMTEFGMSQSRAYQLLDQGRVVQAIEEATGHSTSVELTEAAARDIKPRLRDVTNDIKARLADIADAPDPADIAAVVADVIADHREQAKQRDDDRAALSELSDQAVAAGMDTDKDRVRQRGEFSRLCRDLSKLPEPGGFVEHHGGFLTDRHVHQAEAAYAWLDEFLLTVREGK
jgi:hypothetical protein